MPRGDGRELAGAERQVLRITEYRARARYVGAGRYRFRRVVKADRPNAFVVVETSDVVPWAPGGDDLKIESGKPLPKMGGHFRGGFMALCGDGRVRWLLASMSDEEKIAALFDGKGGEVR